MIVAVVWPEVAMCGSILRDLSKSGAASSAGNGAFNVGE